MEWIRLLSVEGYRNLERTKLEGGILKLHKCCGNEPKYEWHRGEDIFYGYFRCPACDLESEECEDTVGGDALRHMAEKQWNLIFEKNMDDPCWNCMHSGSSMFDCVNSSPSECYFCGESDYVRWQLSSRLG
jgi:hypothetical protein